MDRIILLTNDDGFDAPGLNILREVAREFGEVWIVAPRREQSGSSHSLTLRKDIEVRQLEERFYWVDGTPADCILIAIYKLLPSRPSLIISGINDGFNLAEDVFYSGTVAGAREGAIYGIRSMAISIGNLNGPPDWNTARIWTERLISILLDAPFRLLNINIPNIPAGEVKGFKVVPLGSREYVEPVKMDENGRYRIGGAPRALKTRNTDIGAIKEGYISITPLLINITDNDGVEFLKKVMGNQPTKI